MLLQWNKGKIISVPKSLFLAGNMWKCCGDLVCVNYDIGGVCR